MAERIPQSIAKLIVFRAYLSSDGKTVATGKTIAVTISKNGGAFGNPAAGALNATEISSGFYKAALGTGDADTVGPLAWRGAEGTINDAGDVYEVVKATNAGFSALPDAAAEAAGGVYTRGTGAGQINQPANGMVDANVVRNAGTAITAASGIQEVKVASIATNAITAASINADAITDAKVASDVTIASVTGAVGSVTGSVGSVTGNVGGNVVGSVASVTAAVSLSANDSPVVHSGTAQAGAGSTITLAAGASSTDSIYVGQTVKTTGGTGPSQVRVITGYVGSTKVATVDRAWQTNPSSDTTYAVLATDRAKVDSSLQVTAASVQGNVTGSVASVSGNVSGSIGSLASQAKADVNAESDTALADVGVTTTVTGRIDAAITTRLASAGYTAPPTVGAIADQVWEETLADHSGTSGSTAAALNAAGAAGDPWSTALPGSYGSGTAGKIVGDNINATISSRASQASVDAIDDYVDTEVAAIKAKTDQLTFTVTNQIDSNVLDWKSSTAPAMTGDAYARLGAPVNASISADIAGVQSDTDNIQTRIPASLVSGRIDASVGAMATDVLTASAIATDAIGSAEFAQGAADKVWGAAARVLTAGTNIALAKGTGLTGLNDLSAAQVNAEADTALSDVGLTGTVTGRIDAAVSTRLATAGYTVPLDAAGVRSAVGLGSANLDTQLSTIDDFLDTEVSAIKTKTDNLPSDPADQSAVEAAIANLLTTQLSESYSAHGSAPTISQALFVIMQRLTEFSISGTTITVKKLNGSTTALTLTMDDATAPTSSTRAT